ncbi:MAG: DMT family transporter [Pseudomonadota bacterium]|nr:DMT family transporter [Gammaproteobacteria bacterium]MDQ3581477.1 DMT family transporter [Pseudomonadota bacterium]
MIAGAVCIGFAPIFVRLVDVGYTAAAFWRVALSLPLLFALWFPRRRDPDLEEEPAALRWLWLGGAFFAGDVAVWHQSIVHTSVANATLLANLSPIFITAASFFLYDERVTWGFLVGLILALSGAAVLMADSFTISHEPLRGDIYGVIASVFYFGYLLGVSRLRKRHFAFEVMWWTAGLRGSVAADRLALGSTHQAQIAFAAGDGALARTGVGEVARKTAQVARNEPADMRMSLLNPVLVAKEPAFCGGQCLVLERRRDGSL